MPGATPKTVTPKFSYITYTPLFISLSFRSKLCPGLKRSSALISQADNLGGVDIATVDCGTSTSGVDCHGGVDISGLQDSLGCEKRTGVLCLVMAVILIQFALILGYSLV